jgi:hypothetical protein
MKNSNLALNRFLPIIKLFVLWSGVLSYTIINPSKIFLQEGPPIQIESLVKRLNYTLVKIPDDKSPLNLMDKAAMYSLTLKNEYDKAIAGYAYQLGTNHGRRRVAPQQPIAPGDTFEDRMTIPRNWLEEAMPEGLTLTIQAVIFADNTGDGASEIIKEFQDGRAGAKLQATRISSLLDDYLTKSDDELPRSIDTLMSKLRGLEVSEGLGRSFAFVAALHDEKNLALMEIGELEKLYQEQGEKLYEKFGKDIIRKRLTLIRESNRKKAEQ